MRKVTIVQYRLFHYRTDLFERLREACRDADIDLCVVAGQAFWKEKAKRDEGELPWVRKVRNWYFPIKEKKDLCWQPVPRECARCDLLVVMQENRLLSNYWWMLRRRFGGPRMAFWGHGRDFQTNAPGGIRERWKSATIHQVDWWFAYTPLTVRVLEQFGYPSDRITCLYNAIDTRKFREEVASIDETELAGVRRALGWGTHPGTVAIFCGSLYPDKRLDLLVSAADLIRADLPDFKLIVIGDGSSAAFIKDAVKTRPWCAYVGPKRGRERAKYFRLGDVTLNPGLVGLHVLDSFAAGLPIITTRGAKHSPEIAYVVSGWNGLLTGDDAGSYAAAVSSILSDRRQLDELKRNAALDAQKYTTERMARNFLEGMLACLARPKKSDFAR